MEYFSKRGALSTDMIRQWRFSGVLDDDEWVRRIVLDDQLYQFWGGGRVVQSAGAACAQSLSTEYGGMIALRS